MPDSVASSVAAAERERINIRYVGEFFKRTKMPDLVGVFLYS